MYEVTFVINGVLKKLNVKADDSIMAHEIFTNMYSRCGYSRNYKYKEDLKMEEKQKTMEEIFNELSEENKDVINMVAKGIQIGQQNANCKISEE